MKSSMAFFVLAGATVLAPGTSAKALIGDSIGGLVGGIVGGLTGGPNFSSDILNCGRINNRCKVPFLAPVSGIATCSNGICGMACNSGFSFSGVSNDCILGASGRTRAKKSKVPKSLTLCPSGESACPIAGSASFDIFVQSTDQTADFSSAKGGYECIDTSENVESCGGCASTGQGVDCTALSGVSSVGCSAGQCVVFSCLRSHELSADGNSCVKLSRSASRHLTQRSARSKKHLSRKSANH